MELVRQRMREEVLHQMKEIETCFLARRLCHLLRVTRVALTNEDVQAICVKVAKLCKSAGCKEPAKLCKKASTILMENEDQYLKICRESCEMCLKASKKSGMGEISPQHTYVA